MKLRHDIEHDLEHTIPPPGGPDSQWLFRAMTLRSLAWVDTAPGRRVVDLASGMGQDAMALAQRAGEAVCAAGAAPAGACVVLGIEPSNRMIRFGQHMHRRRRVDAGADPLRLVRGLGEEIPLRSESVDAVLCKGALDHFMDPALTLREIARVLRPGGRAVIALANYDSLSCRLGRRFDGAPPVGEDDGRPYYEPPPDHLTRFTYTSIVALARPPLRARRVEGLSLLWGFPAWGRLLGRLPAPLRGGMLALAGGVARWRPAWADVVLLVAEKAPSPAGS